MFPLKPILHKESTTKKAGYREDRSQMQRYKHHITAKIELLANNSAVIDERLNDCDKKTPQEGTNFSAPMAENMHNHTWELQRLPHPTLTSRVKKLTTSSDRNGMLSLQNQPLLPTRKMSIGADDSNTTQQKSPTQYRITDIKKKHMALRVQESRLTKEFLHVVRDITNEVFRPAIQILSHTNAHRQNQEKITWLTQLWRQMQHIAQTMATSTNTHRDTDLADRALAEPSDDGDENWLPQLLHEIAAQQRINAHAQNTFEDNDTEAENNPEVFEGAASNKKPNHSKIKEGITAIAEYDEIYDLVYGNEDFIISLDPVKEETDQAEDLIEYTEDDAKKPKKVTAIVNSSAAQAITRVINEAKICGFMEAGTLACGILGISLAHFYYNTKKAISCEAKVLQEALMIAMKSHLEKTFSPSLATDTNTLDREIYGALLIALAEQQQKITTIYTQSYKAATLPADMIDLIPKPETIFPQEQIITRQEITELTFDPIIRLEQEKEIKQQISKQTRSSLRIHRTISELKITQAAKAKTLWYLFHSQPSAAQTHLRSYICFPNPHDEDHMHTNSVEKILYIISHHPRRILYILHNPSTSIVGTKQYRTTQKRSTHSDKKSISTRIKPTKASALHQEQTPELLFASPSLRHQKINEKSRQNELRKKSFSARPLNFPNQEQANALPYWQEKEVPTPQIGGVKTKTTSATPKSIDQKTPTTTTENAIYKEQQTHYRQHKSARTAPQSHFQKLQSGHGYSI